MLFPHAPAKLLFFFLTAKYFCVFCSSFDSSFQMFTPNLHRKCLRRVYAGLVEEDEGAPVEGGGVGGAVEIEKSFTLQFVIDKTVADVGYSSFCM